MNSRAQVLTADLPAQDLLLGGVMRASGLTMLAVILIDCAAAVAAVVGVVVWGAITGSPASPLVFAVLIVAILALQISALARQGRTLGRVLCGVRSVDRGTASPVGFSPALGLSVCAPLHPRFVNAQLRAGRDPLDRAFQPVGAEAIRTGTPLTQTRTDAQRPAAVSVPLRRDSPDSLRPERAAAPLDEVMSEWTVASAAPVSASCLLVLDSGEQLTLDRPLLIGRSPAQLPNLPISTLYAWADLSRTISKTHALVEWTGTAVRVTDLGSTNGTALSTGSDERTPLFPFQPQHVGSGGQIELGDRRVHVHTAHESIHPGSASAREES